MARLPEVDLRRDLPPTLGDFAIKREVGRGGMGIVYEATQISSPKPVALKVLPPEDLPEERVVERFYREARSAMRLEHPNIVKVYAFGEDAGFYYYAMEWVDGASLAHIIEQEQEADRNPYETLQHETPAHITRCVRLAIEIADGLEHAHDLGVVHRDIKPGNILIDKSTGRAKITDFGLVWVEGAMPSNRKTEVVGTPRYMAPEALAGKGIKVGRLADVYSLGVTLYEMLALRHPFEGRSPHESWKRSRRLDPVPITEHNRGAPRDLDRIIRKAMARRAGRRYRSAKDLADDLRRFLGGRPVRAHPRILGWLRRS